MTCVFSTFSGAGFRGIGTASEFVSLWLAHLLMLAVTGDESEMNVCKTCTHLRLFDLFEINLRVSTTWNAKHMSLILNLIQHMELFLKIRMLQTQSRSSTIDTICLCLLKPVFVIDVALLRVQLLKSLLLCLRKE